MEVKTNKIFPWFLILSIIGILAHHILTVPAVYAFSYPNHSVETNKMVEKKTMQVKGQPTDDQKQAVKEVCAEEKMGKLCPSILLAMAYRESHYDCSTQGDFKNGVYRSYGCFQIQTSLHGISIEKAQDFKWAAKWTLDRMNRYGFKDGQVSYAVAKHNGGGDAAAAYAKAVRESSKKIANEL